LLLETRQDVVPGSRDAFLVIDSSLLVQAMSRRAERFLAVNEEDMVNHPVAELLVPADAEAQGPTGFAASIVSATIETDEPKRSFVRPWNTFGVRMLARIGPCGPPRAALVVLEDPKDRRLHAVD
jgi:PAS domain-containing protein